MKHLSEYSLMNNLDKAEQTLQIMPNDQMLPKGWICSVLEEICELITDGTHKTPQYVDEGIPFISTANVQPFRQGFDFSSYKRFITLKEHQELCKRCNPKQGDILLSKCGTIGRVKEVDVEYQFSIFVGLALLRPYKGMFAKKFLECLLNYEKFTKNFEKLSPGSTRHTLSLAAIKTIVVTIPPLNEQRRIVAKLEVLLGKVDGCQKRLEKIPRILKRFRQSVLAAACDGRLTADWREGNKDVEPAIKILERVENQNIKTKIDESLFVDDLEMPDKWEIVNIRSICTNSFYGPRFGRDEYVENGIPTIRTTDMTDNGNIVLKDPPKVLVPNNRLKDFQVVKNDLLVTRTGSIGVMAVFKGDYIAIPSAYLIRFRFLPQVITDYVFYFLKSVRGQNLLGLSSTAVTQPNINAEVIKDLFIPLPPLAEQQEIVRRVESLFKLADQLESRYQKAKSYVDKLTQSILAKAFRGELVAQDPNDEPASVLLERIKQEKETATTEKLRKVSVKSKVANKKESKELKELKEIVVENGISNKEKFIEVMEEKISSSLDKIAADVEKLGEQMTLPFMENEK